MPTLVEFDIQFVHGSFDPQCHRQGPPCIRSESGVKKNRDSEYRRGERGEYERAAAPRVCIIDLIERSVGAVR